MLNIELLRDAVEWVEWQNTLDIEKREWNQEVWFADLDALREGSVHRLLGPSIHLAGAQRTECGTVCCVAGYVTQKVDGIDQLKNDFLYRGVMTARGRATQLLGIDNDEASVLFDSENTAEDVRRIAEEIAEGYGVKL
jgi:hypothetical protein